MKRVKETNVYYIYMTHYAVTWVTNMTLGIPQCSLHHAPDNGERSQFPTEGNI